MFLWFSLFTALPSYLPLTYIGKAARTAHGTRCGYEASYGAEYSGRVMITMGVMLML